MSQLITTFYEFIKLDEDLYRCHQHHIKGKILIAPNGINATIAST